METIPWRTEKYRHFRKIDNFGFKPCGLYILKKRIDQLEALMDYAQQMQMTKTLEQLHSAARILGDELPKLEEAAQWVANIYERETLPSEDEMPMIDEEVAELVERLADTL
jgi:hypothetical protein